MKYEPYSTVVEHGHDFFPELATSLFYFIEKLHRILLEQGIERVYFLSREGQPLMRMFDMYCEHTAKHVVSHYLEVSRRSTLLPSLAPLAEENFETLFRQYRCISLFEFLSSLGLEQYTKDIVKTLELTDGREIQREKDFPTSTIFMKLRNSLEFGELYEHERTIRRKAFIDYLAVLSGGELPSRLAIVDVGWKGTIQDNLFALLCNKNDTPVNVVTGYYIGLVAEGAANSRNNKYGLLFSSVGTPSPKFRVFNENRALFEVLLAADHGSIISYQSTENGCAYPVRGEFEESDMLRAEVFPVQHSLFKRFEKLLATSPHYFENKSFFFNKLVKGHSRMVFNPTPQERRWFSSVFHVENYGVFEHSHFAVLQSPQGVVQRLLFLKKLLLRKDIGDLGFWPWNTIYERGGRVAAFIYASIRRLQR
ncbi:hypothetical protein [Serratia microhaemolytica]|uniref:hypothetical protein n=1 Tax=Serratia microhaemolytica TaxID=2675110 RepID=UPI000FDF2A94|nr:hypothetical protein [Serratia microhaemolytica]